MTKKLATITAVILSTISGGIVGAAVGALAALIFNGLHALVPFVPSADVGATAVILGSLLAITFCALVVPIAGDEFKKEAE